MTSTPTPATLRNPSTTTPLVVAGVSPFQEKAFATSPEPTATQPGIKAVNAAGKSPSDATPKVAATATAAKRAAQSPETDIDDDDIEPDAPGGPPLAMAKHLTRPKARTPWGLVMSFLALVAAPGAAATYYWFAVADDRYVTNAGFVVRAVDEISTPDMMGRFTGLMGPTSTSSDTAIVLAFLESRDLVERVDAQVDLEAAWTNADDPIFGYRGSTIEELVDHWTARVVPTHDTTTNLVSVEVQAFKAEDSRAITAALLTEAESLVNRLSERARRDALADSENEVTRAETRLRETAEAQRLFRAEAGALNPMGSAEAMVALVAQKEEALSEVRRQITQIEDHVVATSPQLERLRVDEAGLMGQIAALRGQSGGDANLMAQFESLELEKQFAQQSYASALAALEAARMRANSAQRYLAIYQEPQTAQRAVLPQRPLNAALSVLALFALWSIGALLTRHVRDKMV